MNIIQICRGLVIRAVFCILSLSLISLLTIYFETDNALAQEITDAKFKSKHNLTRSQANRNTVTVVSGGSTTAEIQFTTDLADILNLHTDNSQDLRVLPMIGKGGSQNALDILYLRGVDMAIMQTDTLAYLKGQDPVFYRNINKRINYITRLYNSEWHVIANKSIKTLADLKGKTINISRKHSGTYIASKTILELLGVNVNYAILDDNVALKKLQNGDIDAVAMLSGVPNTIIQNIPRNSGLHLVPVDFFFKEHYKVPFKFVLEHFYFPTKLTHSTYPNLIEQGKKVPTVASGTILAVYNWPQNTIRHKKVARFTQEFFKKFQNFKTPGRHPKWKEVNLSTKVPFWNKFGSASNLLRKLSNKQNSRENSQDIPDQNHTNRVKLNRFLNYLAENKFGIKNFQNLNKQQKELVYRDYYKITSGSDNE